MSDSAISIGYGARCPCCSRRSLLTIDAEIAPPVRVAGEANQERTVVEVCALCGFGHGRMSEISLSPEQSWMKAMDALTLEGCQHANSIGQLLQIHPWMMEETKAQDCELVFRRNVLKPVGNPEDSRVNEMFRYE